jgi:hypothetical protein
MIRSILTLLFLFLLLSCNQKRENQKNYDVTCVIDSVYLRPKLSTLDFDNTYVYETNCNLKFFTKNNDIYKKGDTIVFTIKMFDNEK